MILSFSRKFIFVHIAKCAGESVERFCGSHLPWYDLIIGPRAPGRLPGATPLIKSLTGLAKHSSAAEISAWLGADRFRHFYRFSIVRHPEQRVASYFRYLASMVERAPEVKSLVSDDMSMRSREWSERRKKILSHLSISDRDMEEVFRDRTNPKARVFDRGVLQWGGMRALLLSDDFESFVGNPHLKADRNFSTQKAMLFSPEGDLMVDDVLKIETLDDDWNQVAQHIGLNGGLPKSNTSRNSVIVNVTPRSREIIKSIYSDDYALFGY